MPTLGLDLSNYTTPLSADAVAQFKQAGIELAIIQSISPPPGYPSGQTQQQLTLCYAGGLAVDAYLFFWFDADLTDINNKLALITPYAGQIRQLWLDVEDTAAIKYNQATTESKIQDALNACDQFPTSLGQPTGIYTGSWFWADPRYLDNSSTFDSRKLWDANYDGKSDASVGFNSYGGWTDVAIKQYLGTSTVAGIGNVDCDVLSDAEAATLTGNTPPTDDQQRIADLVTALSDVTGQDGEIRMALANASKLTTVKSIRQALMAIDSRLGQIYTQFLT